MDSSPQSLRRNRLRIDAKNNRRWTQIYADRSEEIIGVYLCSSAVRLSSICGLVSLCEALSGDREIKRNAWAIVELSDKLAAMVFDDRAADGQT
jgi:hypothetical protein